MRNERTGEETVEQLRAKYAQLARKYAGLVERLEKRTQQQAAVFRLGWFGLHATGAAMALVESDRLVLANRRWRQLGVRNGPWVWRSPGEKPARRYPDLAELALGEARLALATEEGALVEIFDRADSDASLELRLEVLSERDRRVVVLATDVTERVRREAELLQTREALLQKEQLRVLGELTTSVTHDIGNTLRAIQARLTVLGTELSFRTHRSMLAVLTESLDEALRSLRQLHQTARTGRLTPVPVRVDELVARAAAVLHLDGADGIELDIQLDGLPVVIGTPAELSHLFVTLLRNARQAMANGGRIAVSGSVRSGSVLVRISDAGTGIPEDVMPRLFEPFFTTKGENGTGLGLWLAASTMRRLGGAIQAHNRRGGGAVFTLRFPIANGAKAKVRRGSHAPRPRLPGRRVLS